MFFALLFILLGIVYLLKNLNIISVNSWGVIWPSVLIIIGIYMLLKERRYKMFWDKVWRKMDTFNFNIRPLVYNFILTSL